MPPTTATSRALQCPELLRLICKQIGTDDKRTLSWLYLTCRSFMEPALDELWYKLDNLDPLVRCMDNDLVERVKKDRVVTLVSNCFSITRLNLTPPNVVFSKIDACQRLGTL
jgi:hypothetical protein